MNYLQLCQETRRECGIQGSGPSAVAGQSGLLERLIDWVADADEHICMLHHDWDFLWAEFSDTTTVSDDSLAAPSDFGIWDRESFAISRGTINGRPLTVVPYKEWRKYHGAKSNEEPASITIKPDKSLVFPYPANAVYTVTADYWKTVTRMSEDTSTPSIPAKFHRIIICKAKMMFYEDQQFPELYQLAKDEYQEWLNKLEAAELPGQHFRGQGEAIPLAIEVE